MVCWKLHKACLLKVGQMQSPEKTMKHYSIACHFLPPLMNCLDHQAFTLQCGVNLDGLGLSDQWEVLECNGHMPLGPLHTQRLRVCDRCTSSILSLVEKVEPIQAHFAWGTNKVSECKKDVKVYMESHMTSNGSCFMVTWTSFVNLLLEVGLTQTRETMAFQNLTAADLVYFYHVWGPCMNRNSLK